MTCSAVSLGLPVLSKDLVARSDDRSLLSVRASTDTQTLFLHHSVIRANLRFENSPNSPKVASRRKLGKDFCPSDGRASATIAFIFFLFSSIVAKYPFSRCQSSRWNFAEKHGKHTIKFAGVLAAVLSFHSSLSTLSRTLAGPIKVDSLVLL